MRSVFKVNDAISDPIEKSGSHIILSEVIPICDMTLQDWKDFGWHSIRGVAKNRIARLLRDGSLEVFIRIKYDRMPLEPPDDTGGKPKPKSAYYYGRGGRRNKVAATEEDIRQVRQWANEPEEELSEDSEIIDAYIDELQLPFLYNEDILTRLTSRLKVAGACSGLLSIIKGGMDERGPVWAFVLVVALIIYFGFDRAFEIIEEEI